MLRAFRLFVLPLLLFFLASACTAGATPSPQAPPGCQAVYSATTRGGRSFAHPGDRVLVQRVVDGDTIALADGERVRYIGVDTPEVSGQPEFFGIEASQANRRLVQGQQVRLERDVSERDRFDRLLRYVYVDGVMINAELVREGFARAAAYPPDTRYARCFAALAEEARSERRGMWERSPLEGP